MGNRIRNLGMQITDFYSYLCKRILTTKQWN